MNTTVEEAPQDANTHLLETESLSAKSLIAVMIILIYIVAGPVFEKINFYFIHESGLCMLIGMTISVITYFISPLTSFSTELRFNDAMFFTFILPPIIFSAGYNMRCKNFFKYFHYSIIFGIIGTFMTFLIITVITVIFNFVYLFGIRFNLKDILLFSAVISATDTVSPLAFVSEAHHNKLFTVLFGEGIMNDSFSIVMYQLITRFYGVLTTGKMVTYFIFLFFSSLVLGILVGMAASLFLKYMKPFKLQRAQEITVILIFAYISYTMAELFDLSPIISLLFCSISLSNYAFYNLSFPAREESCIVAKILSSIAEAFVFTYLGLSFFSMAQTEYSLTFALIEFFTVIFARYITVFFLTGITNSFSSNPFRPLEKQIISIAGCIRGAVAFGLAMTIETGDQLKNTIILSTTLLLVFVTILVFGASVPMLTKGLKHEEAAPIAESYYLLGENEEEEKLLNAEDKEKQAKYKLEHPNNNSLSREECVENLSVLGKMWLHFDGVVLKPILVYDWENCFKEHIDLTKKIKKTMNE